MPRSPGHSLIISSIIRSQIDSIRIQTLHMQGVHCYATSGGKYGERRPEYRSNMQATRIADCVEKNAEKRMKYYNHRKKRSSPCQKCRKVAEKQKKTIVSQKRNKRKTTEPPEKKTATEWRPQGRKSAQCTTFCLLIA